MSAIAAWKAKHNPFSKATSTEVSQHTLPPNEDKENNGVAPPAKKQKVEPQVQPSGPKPPKKKYKSRVKLLPLPVPRSSQSSAQFAGSRGSPIIIDPEDATGRDDAPVSYYDTKVPRGGKLLEDGPGSGTEESRIGDSE